MSSTSDHRPIFEQIRRGLLQTIAPIQKAWPDAPFRLEIKVVKLDAPSSTRSE